MRLEGLERYSAGTGPLHRLDARIKLIAALVLVLVVVATPFGSWTALGCEGLLLAFIVGLAGIPPRELARRWLAFFVLAAFLTLMVAPAHPARTQHGLWIVAAIDPDQEQSCALDHAGSGRDDASSSSCLPPFASWVLPPCSSPRSSSWTDTAMSSSTNSTAWPPPAALAPSTAAAAWPGACSRA